MRACLETLGLLEAWELLDPGLQKAAADSATYGDFLSNIFGEETAKRQQK